jgi:hypothetical protein
VEKIDRERKKGIHMKMLFNVCSGILTFQEAGCKFYISLNSFVSVLHIDMVVYLFYPSLQS